MKQWEIYDYPFADEGSHPVLILSNPARSQNEAFAELNGLFCRSVRPHFQPKPFHFVLDDADRLGQRHGGSLRPCLCAAARVHRRSPGCRFHVPAAPALSQGSGMFPVPAAVRPSAQNNARAPHAHGVPVVDCAA